MSQHGTHVNCFSSLTICIRSKFAFEAAGLCVASPFSAGEPFETAKRTRMSLGSW